MAVLSYQGTWYPSICTLEAYNYLAINFLSCPSTFFQGLGFPVEIQWIPLDFRQRSGFWWKFQRGAFASFPLEQVGAVPKGVPVSGGNSGGNPLDWSSIGTGAQTLSSLDLVFGSSITSQMGFCNGPWFPSMYTSLLYKKATTASTLLVISLIFWGLTAAPLCWTLIDRA